jgi:uncharacterized protein
MATVFLDTGFVLALELVDDQHHEAALKHWQSLMKMPPELVTTSYVFDEIVTFLSSRNRHDKAVEVGNRLLRSSSIQFIQVSEAIFFEGWQYFQQHEDKSYSLTDCISFIVMTTLNIQTALTFDKHFTQAGFEKFS